VEWTVRTVDFAVQRGATMVSVIPVRAGNGEMERLSSLGAFTPPTLAQLEMVLDRCVERRPSVVTADLWDVAKLPGCSACRDQRIARMEQMNARGRLALKVECGVCGSGGGQPSQSME
jgi:hypothetical protein